MSSLFKKKFCKEKLSLPVHRNHSMGGGEGPNIARKGRNKEPEKTVNPAPLSNLEALSLSTKVMIWSQEEAMKAKCELQDAGSRKENTVPIKSEVSPGHHNSYSSGAGAVA